MRKETTMECNQCRELLIAYEDGALSAAEQAAAEEHLAHCAQCRRQWEGAQKLQRDLSQLRARAPEGFSQTVMQRLRTERKPARRSIGRLASGLCAAACLLLIFMSPLLLKKAGKNETSVSADLYDVQQTANAAPRETETETEAVMEEGAYSELSGGCLSEAVRIEMEPEDMRWLAGELQELWKEHGEEHMEETEDGYLLYDVAPYETQLRQLLQQKGYEAPAELAEMLYVELIPTER